MTLYNIYYSPTGGTKRVSDIISGAMSESFDRIDLIRKDGFERCFGKNDICIISVPAFGGRVPEDALNKIRCFKAEGTRAVLVAVFGNRAIDDTLAELYDTVREAGFDVIAAIEAVAEHSLVPQYGSGRPNAEDSAELEGFARHICKSIDNRLEDIPGNRPYKEFHPSSMTLALDDTCINCKKVAFGN